MTERGPRGDVVRRPQRFHRGDQLTAERLNELQDPVSRLGRNVSNLQEGLAPYIWRQVFQAIINAVHPDFLDLREYREYSSGQTWTGSSVILAAKPWLLRQSPFDGKTIGGISYAYTDSQTRTATQGPTVETQRVTPQYLSGDIVFCARNVYGGVSVQDPTGALVALVVDEVRVWAADPPP